MRWALLAGLFAWPAAALGQATGGSDEVGDRREIATLRGLAIAIRACWAPPRGLALLERVSVTARFGLRADGSVLGEPRITFSTAPADTRARDLLARSARDAVRACSPVPLTARLGRAIAGRPLTIQFIHQSPRGQGA